MEETCDGREAAHFLPRSYCLEYRIYLYYRKCNVLTSIRQEDGSYPNHEQEESLTVKMSTF
jgi:hypothetical protein